MSHLHDLKDYFWFMIYSESNNYLNTDSLILDFSNQYFLKGSGVRKKHNFYPPKKSIFYQAWMSRIFSQIFNSCIKKRNRNFLYPVQILIPIYKFIILRYLNHSITLFCCLAFTKALNGDCHFVFSHRARLGDMVVS